MTLFKRALLLCGFFLSTLIAAFSVVALENSNLTEVTITVEQDSQIKHQSSATLLDGKQGSSNL